MALLITNKGKAMVYYGGVYALGKWAEILRRLRLAWKRGKETELFTGQSTYWFSSRISDVLTKEGCVRDQRTIRGRKIRGWVGVGRNDHI